MDMDTNSASISKLDPAGSEASMNDGCLQQLQASMGLNPADPTPMINYFRCANKTDFVEAIRLAYRSLQDSRRSELPLIQAIISVYAVFMAFGVVGNGLVIYAVAANRHMRTPRNLYIVNLAISDLILCAFTQPLNIVRLFQRYRSWEFGLFLCKTVNTVTGVNVFLSTYAITAIALDRFQVIAYPNLASQSSGAASICVACLWVASALLASPLAWFASVTTVPDPFGGADAVFCGEMTTDATVKRWKAIYSGIVLVFQYLIPLSMVVIAYGTVCRRLNQKVRRRHAGTAGLPSNNTIGIANNTNCTNNMNACSYYNNAATAFQRRRLYLEQRRGRRANLVLLLIAVVFAVSWLPLTLCNVYHDIADLSVQQVSSASEQQQQPGDGGRNSTWEGGSFHTLRNIESVGRSSVAATVALHFAPPLLVLVSACLNPVFYGLFNYNFQTELRRICQRLLLRVPGRRRQVFRRRLRLPRMRQLRQHRHRDPQGDDASDIVGTVGQQRRVFLSNLLRLANLPLRRATTTHSATASIWQPQLTCVTETALRDTQGDLPYIDDEDQTLGLV